MAQTKDFTVRVPPEVHSKLKTMADEQYTSIATVARQILSKAVQIDD